MSRTTFQAAFTREFINDAGELALGDIGLELLEATPLVQYRFLDAYEDVVTPSQIQDIDGLSLHDPHVTAETFAQGAERLIVIACCRVGYDLIDVEACTKADVVVVNAPNALRFPTASAALMYMLVLSKQLWKMDRLVREGRWDLRDDVKGIEPQGKTLGIVGFGSIARELARLVGPFEMRILAYDPYVDPEFAQSLNAELVPLDALLRESDFVSLHCILTEETHGLIGRRELALMKPTAFLINMSRGPVVDHSALVEVLTENRIRGAGLDVFYQEPLPVDDPLTRLDNVVLSPHWAAGTLDVFRDAGASNCRAFLALAEGQLPEHIVNPEVVGRPGFQSKLVRFSDSRS